MRHAFQVAAGWTWAITEDCLRGILAWANDETPDRALLERLEAAQVGRAVALAAKRADPLQGSESVTVRDGVAIVPVVGPIFQRANLFTDMSGATSTELLARDLSVALADPSVRGILLSIDSPGGEAAGINELAKMIHAARGVKPVTAYVGGMAASAGYWLASAADRIVTDDMGLLGSVGVVMRVGNPSAKSAQDIEFVSSQSPKKRPDPSTEAGKAQIQALVDDMASVFIASVARNRGVTEEQALAQFGAGALLMGQKAVDAGLADAIGTFEGTLAAMASAVRPSSMAAHARQKETIMAEHAAVPMAQEGVTATLLSLPATHHHPDDLARLARLEAQNQHFIGVAAETFAAEQVAAGRALPAQRPLIQALFAQAAKDDSDNAVVLALTDGKTGGRLDALKGYFGAVQANGLTQELVPTRQMPLMNTTQTKEQGADTPDMAAAMALIAGTPDGAAWLNTDAGRDHAKRVLATAVK